MRVFNPSVENEGWDSSHTIVQIATNDMPFLVDSVGIAAQLSKVLLHSVIHPVYFIARDAGGHLLSLAVDDTNKGNAESIMHVEIDKLAEPADLEKLHAAINAALHDVALCVEDWSAMRQKMRDMAEELGQWRLPLDAEGVNEAQEFLRWAAEDHFTFLGYREYHVVKKDNDEVLEASPKTGLGILRTADRAVAPRTLKGLVAHELRQSGKADAIIMTKTNARSTVHRSGYMDYIGVLEFDAAGKPQVEHRFLGLFASGAYSRRPWEIPLVRRKYESVMARSGFKRDSHSGKTLRNIIETLPRDELFQSERTNCSTPRSASWACRAAHARACSCAATSTAVSSRASSSSRATASIPTCASASKRCSSVRSMASASIRRSRSASRRSRACTW